MNSQPLSRNQKLCICSQVHEQKQCSSPDGLGLFCLAALETVKPQVMELLHDFYTHSVQLERLNRSHMV